MKKNPLPSISDAEWEVMKVLWEQHPLTAAEIIERLSDHHWKPKTVKTLISRLVQKKAIDFHKRSRAYAYYPIVDQKACIREESRSFLNRIYGGSLKPMLVHFLEDEQLSEDEIKELKQLLEQRIQQQ